MAARAALVSLSALVVASGLQGPLTEPAKLHTTPARWTGLPELSHITPMQCGLLCAPINYRAHGSQSGPARQHPHQARRTILHARNTAHVSSTFRVTVYVHIAKTGGTAIAHHLQESAALANFSFYRFTYNPDTKLSRVVNDTKGIEEINALFQQSAKPRVVVSAHEGIP